MYGESLEGEPQGAAREWSFSDDDAGEDADDDRDDRESEDDNDWASSHRDVSLTSQEA